MQEKTFEVLWRTYVSGREEDADDHLRACLKVATTLNEMRRVFNASFDGALSSDRVRGPTLKKMIATVQTELEAQIVYRLASACGKNGYYFPARMKEARAKLDSLKKVV